MRQHDIGIEVVVDLGGHNQCQTVVIAVGVLPRHLVLQLDVIAVRCS